MSQVFTVKEALKGVKLNPVQKMTLSNRFKAREFAAPSETDNVYEVVFGQTVIQIRANDTGLVPEEMDVVADILQRTRKNEQKAMLDMLVCIQVFPLAQETVDVLTAEWRENGVESKLLSGPAFSQTEDTVTP